MEGITDWVFRGLHRKMFPGLDRYYMPFLSPSAGGRFDRRAFRDILPEHNAAVPALPQLMTRKSADFLWAVRILKELGYPEVNLNLGCPSGTVTAKGKGAGQLRDLPALAAFLDEIFSQSPLPISIKTRLGMKREEEFIPLLELFGRYPICELIVHTRLGEDFYRKPARMEMFRPAVQHSAAPLCYNGDLLTLERFQAFAARFPRTPAVMLGRGLVADPALFRRCQGGDPADRETLRKFHNELFEAYCSSLGSRRSAMSRMKEFWFYHSSLFQEGDSLIKRLRKTTDAGEYQALTARIYDELPLRPGGALADW